MNRKQLALKILAQVVKGDAQHSAYAMDRIIRVRPGMTEEESAAFDKEWPFKTPADFQLPLIEKVLDELSIEVR